MAGQLVDHIHDGRLGHPCGGAVSQECAQPVDLCCLGVNGPFQFGETRLRRGSLGAGPTCLRLLAGQSLDLRLEGGDLRLELRDPSLQLLRSGSPSRLKLGSNPNQQGSLILRAAQPLIPRRCGGIELTPPDDRFGGQSELVQQPCDQLRGAGHLRIGRNIRGEVPRQRNAHRLAIRLFRASLAGEHVERLRCEDRAVRPDQKVIGNPRQTPRDHRLRNFLGRDVAWRDRVMDHDAPDERKVTIGIRCGRSPRQLADPVDDMESRRTGMVAEETLQPIDLILQSLELAAQLSSPCTGRGGRDAFRLSSQRRGIRSQGR